MMNDVVELSPLEPLKTPAINSLIEDGDGRNKTNLTRKVGTVMVGGEHIVSIHLMPTTVHNSNNEL